MQDGILPLFRRTPKRAEWRLLENVAKSLVGVIDYNELKLILDISQKGDIERYNELTEYWGLRSINPQIQPVGPRDAALYQLSSLLKKLQIDDRPSVEQIEVARHKFFQYEREMYQYNRTGYRSLVYSVDPKVQHWFTRMRSFIADVLGKLNFAAVTRYSRHGPGGTFGLSSQYGHRFYKNARIPYEVTSSALPMARAAILRDARWRRAIVDRTLRSATYRYVANHTPILFQKPHKVWQLVPSNAFLFRVVPGNRIEFVPKDSKQARTIACEPTMNVFLQLGVDGYIRTRLKKFGIDIDDQMLNQRLARAASISNELSTIDLSGASDTVSLRLVEALFPYDWVEYLYNLRSDTGFIGDTAVRYEKLSSMGNGYTFAVETLVFAACVYATNPETVFGDNAAVYGDDIIAPTATFEDLHRLLNLCGFSLNVDKSFYDNSHVRESCGTDWYKGENIRPIFLRRPLEKLDLFNFYSLHNGLAEWFSRILYIEDPLVCRWLRNLCNPKYHLYGPPILGDQSTYLAIPKSPYGMDNHGFIHDRAVAQAETFAIQPEDFWFGCLNHTLTDVPERQPWEKNLASGSRFKVTKRGRYKVIVNRRGGRCFTWPVQYHEI